MNEKKIKAVLEVVRDAHMKVNAMADSLSALAQAAKKSNLDLIALDTILQQKDPEPEPSDPEPGEKKEQK